MKNVDNFGEKLTLASKRRAIRGWAFFILFGLFCLLLPVKSFAQSSNRWLIIFNTSAAMRDRSNGVEMVTADLLTTAMHGTIRPGDTIGIWTYNSALHADEAPLQTWYPNTAPAIAQNTAAFVHQHAYQNAAVFDDVLANMLRVIKMSDVITVILISDGSDSFKGTAFDAQLSEFYKTNSRAQRKARMPIVTVFRGEKGSITTNTMALAPWPVDIPAVPPPPVVAQAVQKPAPVAPPKPVPSLVMIGKKAETTFNPPQDLPDHVDQVALPEEKPAPTPAKAETKVETPPPAAESVPAPKVEEKPAPVVAAPVAPPIVATPVAPPIVATPAPAAVAPAEPAKPVPAPEVKVTSAPSAETAATPSAAPLPTVAAAPAVNVLSVRNIAIASVTFTIIVCGLLFMTARNARNASRASLITRSLDRERS